MGNALEGLVEIAYFVTVQGLREICKGLTSGERRLLISLPETKQKHRSPRLEIAGVPRI
jgi:hypothetical protein